MKTIKTHLDLDVWKQSIILVTEIYEITKGFPKDELFGLTSQIRRSAISVPSNISEGSARNQSKEFIRFLQISQGSLSELETQLIISRELGYCSSERFIEVNGNLHKIRAQISGLIQFLRNRMEKNI
jgi:four helix bundle protein